MGNDEQAGSNHLFKFLKACKDGTAAAQAELAEYGEPIRTGKFKQGSFKSGKGKTQEGKAK